MRTVSLKIYSRTYLLKHSNAGCLNLKQLYEEASNDNPRLLYPLFVYAYLFNKKNIFKKSKLYMELLEKASKYDRFDDFMKNTEEKELNNYYQSYLSFNQRKDNTELKEKLRKFYLVKKQEYHFSDYSVCRDNALNNGNFHAFMYKMEDDKLSYNKCMELLNYLYNLPEKENYNNSKSF